MASSYAKSPLDLIPNEIHHIKLQTKASILMSEKGEINHEAMDLINFAHLGVEHLPVNPMHDVINREEVLGITWDAPSQNVKGSKVIIIHGALLNVHSKQTSRCGVINNRVAHALAKLSPSSSHHFVPSHLDDLSLFGLVEVNGGIELGNDIFINDKVELHQRQEPKILTNSFGLAKVL
jgi:hypothetical protein